MFDVVFRFFFFCFLLFFFFFFKQKTAYEIGVRLVGSEMCIRDSAKADNAGAAALLADAEHKKRAAAPQKKRYDFDF